MSCPLMHDPSAILLFMKAPVLGQVKSRIAAGLGEETTLDLYRNLALDTLDAVEQTGLPVHICVHPPDAIRSVSSWVGGSRTFAPQVGADLGERMERSFRAIFAEGIGRAVLVGCDLPGLPAKFLLNGMSALNASDAVIGPARDGGYYLIGFRRDGFLPGVFRDIAWGGPDVFEQTMRTFSRSGTAVRTLPSWRDADTIDDLRNLMQGNGPAPLTSTRTARYLYKIRERLRVQEDIHGKI